MNRINLTHEEKNFVESYEKHFSERAKYSITLEYLLETWEKVAKSLETGYKLEYEDYLNDLDGRFLLEKILTNASDNLKSKIRFVLDKIDTEFKKETKLDVDNIIPDGFKQKGGWWYTRVPIKWKNR